ncbi:unnamed protein product [Caenorhabditis sp. 36 PRJEB53466]|nr:unnamed protein product [Caenorhabditis sp. 36 PRJEB53466]
MDSLHCFNCHSFPSKDTEFFVTNCMHIFCATCKKSAEPEPPENGAQTEPSKCTECEKGPLKFMKIGPDMPAQVKQMFLPVTDDIQTIGRNMNRIITFQNWQRANLLSGLTKKERAFDRLRTAWQDEKSEKEQYKRKLEEMRKMLKKQKSELTELKSISAERPASLNSTVTPSMVRVFSDSMYNTPKNAKKALPAFLKAKSMASQAAKNQEMLKTPVHPPKTSMGFVTPKNPPHMFPHLNKQPVPKVTKKSSA